ncbi:MAG TPA: hypothetical protein VMD56_09245 [Steroidobacteraceae bacterium]|nr:hypothetical protein [Steroidobacteraceae bacterium]
MTGSTLTAPEAVAAVGAAPACGGGGAAARATGETLAASSHTIATSAAGIRPAVTLNMCATPNVCSTVCSTAARMALAAASTPVPVTIRSGFHRDLPTGTVPAAMCWSG